jgi:hypothetical protein
MKYKNLIVLAMLVLMGTMAFYGLKSQVLILSSVDIQAEAKALELAKLSLKRQRIAYQSEHVGRLGLWQTIGVSVIAAGAGSAALSGLTYAIFAGVGYVRQRSLVPQQIGGSTLTVHYRTVKDPAFAVMMTGTLNIEAIRAQNPQIAAEMAMKLVEAFPRLAGRLAGTHSEGGDIQLALPAAPIVTPTFRDILSNLEPGDPMYLGTDTTTGEPVTGTFDDLYSSFFAGESGSGKSSWLRGILAQSLICSPGATFHILDPHAKRPDSLSASLPRCDAFVRIAPDDPTPGLYAFNRMLSDRLDAPEDTVFPPLVFVCDELNYCSKQRYAVTLQTLFDRIATEGRKVWVYLLVSSQDTRMKKGLDFRDCLASSYVFRMKPKQASYLLQDSEETAKHKRVRGKGEALLNLTTGESQIVKVPFCAPSDFLRAEQEFVRVANGAPVASVGNVAATQEPVACAVASDVAGGCDALTLPEQVSVWMQNHNTTLSGLALQCGINKGTLSKFLNTGKLSDDNVQKLEAFFLENAEADNEKVIDLAKAKADRAQK